MNSNSTAEAVLRLNPSKGFVIETVKNSNSTAEAVLRLTECSVFFYEFKNSNSTAEAVLRLE